MTDPIADMLSRIKNALNIKADTVDIPHSTVKENIAKVFTSEGYIAKFGVLKKMNRKFLRLALRYRSNKQGVIFNLHRVSKPGRRIYATATNLPRVQAGYGTAVISTSAGVVSDAEAREKKVGGEVLCYIW